MNGFTLWVLLAATGQVSEAPERDFAWQISPRDGKLEYVVQISPNKADIMVSAQKENASDVPPEVAARLSRVVVRIGTEPLVSASMDDVLRLPPVTTAVLANIEATAGRGKFSQLESGPSGDVVNVSGGGLPSAPTTSLSDQARSLAGSESLLAQNTLGSSFSNDGRGLGSAVGNSAPSKFSNTGAPPASSLPSSPSPQLPSGSSSPSGNTGIVGPMLPGSNYQTSPGSLHSQPNLPSSGIGTSGIGTSGIGSSSSSGGLGNYPGAGNQPNATGNAPYSNPGYNQPASGNQGMYGSSNTGLPNANSTSAGQMPPGYGTTSPLAGSSPNMGNFGSPPRAGDAQQLPYNQYATVGGNQGHLGQNPYASTPYGANPYGQSPNYGGMNSTLPSDPVSLPNYNQPMVRVADSRASAGVPSTSSSGLSNPSSNTASAPPTTTSRTTPSHSDSDSANSYPARSGMDNVVPVMFVLSLVVNFYLGMLIRKLLGRYRSLLSSVRSQAV